MYQEPQAKRCWYKKAAVKDHVIQARLSETFLDLQADKKSHLVSAVMINLLCLTIAAAFIFDAVELGYAESPCDDPSQIVGWTEWFNRDEPTDTEDRETLYRLHSEYPGRICPSPVDIEARTVSGISACEAGEVVVSDPSSGFVCINEDQPDGICYDYKVRFSCPPVSCAENLCWTKYFDRDEPTVSGDWETLEELRVEYPRDICNNPLYIQAVTKDTMTSAASTGDKFLFYNPTVGFVCRNEDQTSDTCKNYKVRFACPCN